MKRPRRKRPNPAHSPAYVPYVEPPKTFGHTRLVLLVGVLLTVLTVFLMVNRVELRKMLRSVTAVNTQAAPAPMPANLLPHEEREFRHREVEQYKSAHRTAGFMHTIGLVVIGCFLFWDFLRRCENDAFSAIGPNFSGYVAVVGIGLIYINVLILLGRFVYYPLFDWSWEALGNQMVEYEHTTSRRWRGRSRASSYQGGVSLAIAFLMLLVFLWHAATKLLARDASDRR
ncbi:hypothetical protein [Massilia aquatica]|uniref:Uncharacterized protein n=1 Tax=Massilia aquatica TaxID=2609000 RepID=A0ABX0MCB7_9BURK|nr:hypothetical protein [Massilia aquatica]NHZ42610.1 hypothetical protein [Massilia aquatica]